MKASSSAKLLCCVLAAFVTGILGQDKPSLEIQPNLPEVTKEVGGSLAVTCRPRVQDPTLVTQLEWINSKGRRIDKIKSYPIYSYNLPDEKGTVLVFNSLTENQGGPYICRANYANTEPLQATIVIKTFVDIKFIDAPENQYPISGTDFIIRCKVNAMPPPIIDWNKNDKSIQTNEKYVVTEDGLLIRNVSAMDDGEYKCTAVVLTTGQIKTRNINVEVQVPPKVLPMEEITVIEGEIASTVCQATGKPRPTYRWIKESTREDLAKTDRFSVKQTAGDLLIHRVEFIDNGFYSCIAENQAGRANQTVKINVLIKPNIYELLNVTAAVTVETKIICKARGQPPPEITFRKLSSKVPFKVSQQADDKRITLEQQFFPEKGESFGTLIISNLNRSDDGLYECIAKNKAATAYKNGHIAVEFPPTFNRTKDFPPVWSWPGKPGNLSCLPEAIPNATVTWKFNDIEIKEGNIFKIEVRGAHSFLIVNAGNEPRYYTYYECEARNRLGKAKIKINLKRASVPEMIPNAKAQSITATTIKFEIAPPSNFDGLPLRSITVQFKPERTLQWDMAANHTWSYGAPYILEGLVPEQTYQFKFAARNDVGMGAFMHIEPVTMPRRSEPAEPKILYSSHNIKDENSSNRMDLVEASPYADHYELRWNVPNNNGDPIQHYLIRYCVTEKINGEWRDSDCSEQIQQSVQHTNYQLDVLQPDTTYKIELRAHNAIGDSSPAQIRVKTARGQDPIIPLKSSPSMSSSTIIGIVIGSVLLVLIVVDITCFCVNRTGIIALLCDHSKSKQHEEEDPKLGREEREPLKQEPYSMTVEYDGKQVFSKSGEIIGKHSAV